MSIQGYLTNLPPSEQVPGERLAVCAALPLTSMVATPSLAQARRTSAVHFRSQIPAKANEGADQGNVLVPCLASKVTLPTKTLCASCDVCGCSVSETHQICMFKIVFTLECLLVITGCMACGRCSFTNSQRVQLGSKARQANCFCRASLYYYSV